MLNKKGKVIVFIIYFLIFTGVAFFTFKLGVTFVDNYPKESVVEMAVPTANVNYEVCLIKNNYIEERCLPKNRSYIMSLIEDINSKFTYYFNDENIKSYHYEVVAKINSKYLAMTGKNVNNPIWEKEEIIKKGNLVYGNVIKIDEDIKIDILYYDSLVKSFSNELSVPVESVLDVTLNVYFDTENKKDQKHSVSLTMPLNTVSFDISETQVLTEQTKKENKSLQGVYSYLITYILAIIALLVTAINVARFVREGAKHKYRQEIDKILKNYSNRIIEISNFVDYTKFKVIDVINFDELLNLSDEVFEPIMYWEKREDRESWFSIFHHNILYRFILRREEESTKKEIV